jgi:tRNA wybutosine-synthesizing protein 4
MLAKNFTSCEDTVFVDVDYPELIREKCEAIAGIRELWDLLDDVVKDPDSDLPIRSDRYVAIGCDLGNVEKLDRVLRGCLDISRRACLAVAEVSIAYMDVQAADTVIRWAAGLGEGRSFEPRRCFQTVLLI